MTPESLTTGPPNTMSAICAVCHRHTTAPVEVRHLQPPDAPGTTVYTCPQDTGTLQPGPGTHEHPHTRTAD
ncbi:hypothetical protein ACIBCM_27645 [Streptomyces sp. NPDC051018]|uniref:hypothetical protein n=1 Tax=Streptomyces sp. NPDC051018 TaxID=3365639 RepID=UPI003795647F